jgi:hypothetical protein
MPLASTPEDHQVVGEEAKAELAVLAVRSSGPQRGAQAAFEH